LNAAANGRTEIVNSANSSETFSPEELVGSVLRYVSAHIIHVSFHIVMCCKTLEPYLCTLVAAYASSNLLRRLCACPRRTSKKTLKTLSSPSRHIIRTLSAVPLLLVPLFITVDHVNAQVTILPQPPTSLESTSCPSYSAPHPHSPSPTPILAPAHTRACIFEAFFVLF
jgi:hypothetical protein